MGWVHIDGFYKRADKCMIDLCVCMMLIVHGWMYMNANVHVCMDMLQYRQANVGQLCAWSHDVYIQMYLDMCAFVFVGWHGIASI
jgi:hypothetical protein